MDKRNLTLTELQELTELNRLVGGEKFKAIQVKGNTALVPDGQKYAEQAEAVSRLMENVRNNWLSQKLVECGYAQGEKASIDLNTGAVVATEEVKPEVKDEPVNDSEIK